ncbi:LPS export ABC transporter permease LptF [Betaproteobacteria bacterium]|nr:LPS export ABC transporter permease LptF [Betaproteobacteria bacterium]GHU42003.1 LPS export ABC transporter permease LptF [Betaproteobacteria bacterium]
MVLRGRLSQFLLTQVKKLWFFYKLMPMIFERAARREFAHAAAGVFVALFAILISTQLIRLLNEAAGGRLAPEAVAALLGFAALNYLPVVLSLTLFMAILMSLSRAYRDSEMVVWFSSGLPLTAWLRPVGRFALPVVLVVAMLSMFLSPWALSRSAEYRNQLDAKSDASQIAPGAFREASSGGRIVFVEKLSEDAREVQNVFVTSVQEGRLGVVMADRGMQETAENGDRFLVLQHGQRYEAEPGTPEFRVMNFERYSVRIQEGAAKETEQTPKTTPIWELDAGNDVRAAGELLWRVGLPAAALLLAFLAVPLSFVNPRAGRSMNMVFAIVVFSLYNNLLSLTQAWVARGKLSFEVALVAPHLCMLLVLAALFFHRLSVLSFARLVRVKR